MKSLQETLDSIKYTKKTIWDDAPNGWVRTLGPGDLGRVTEHFAELVLGGKRNVNNKEGYDLICAEKKVEVKAASLCISGGRPIFYWKAIRPTDPYTHIFFIAIYPDNIRGFLVPRENIPESALSRMSAKGSTNNNYQIATRNTNMLLPWMLSHEVLNSNADMLAKKISDEKKQLISNIKNKCLSPNYPEYAEYPVDILELSVRSANALKNANISTIGQLINMSESEFQEIPHMGLKSIGELDYVLHEFFVGADDIM